MINIKNKKKINKIVHYVNNDLIYASKGIRIYTSTDYGKNWDLSFKLPVGFIQKFKNISKLSRRLFREGVHHIIYNENKYLTIFAGKYIYIYKMPQKKLVSKKFIAGSRPLCITSSSDGTIYYGEYRNNDKREPVKILASRNGNDWINVYKFKDIRHIHGIFYDKYTDSIWVTTGDYNFEIGLWNTNDNYKSIKKVVGDIQQFRAVQLLFTKKFIYFSSDTPLEVNHIYRMCRKTKIPEKLQEIGGSVFYGCKINNELFFSTVCEPSKVNKSNFVELWSSDDSKNWKLILKLKKDIWHKKYFQYGQIKFPYNENNSNFLWFTPLATEFDQKSFKIDLNDKL